MSRTTLLVLPFACLAAACYEYSRGSSERQVVCQPDDGTPTDDGTPGDSGPPEDDCPTGVDATYLSDAPLSCAAITFECPEGYARFDSACGCGCAPVTPPSTGTSSTCPDADEPDVFYLGTGGKICDEVEFTCPAGSERFDSPCGCGCWPTCPDPKDARVHYLSDDPAICDLITFSCPSDCVAFDDRCGCGCIEPAAGAGCPDPDDPDVLYVSTSTTICGCLR
jgi:hypothetical protein